MGSSSDACASKRYNCHCNTSPEFDAELYLDSDRTRLKIRYLILLYKEKVFQSLTVSLLYISQFLAQFTMFFESSQLVADLSSGGLGWTVAEWCILSSEGVL